MSMYSYCTFLCLHRASWHSSANLTEVFPCFFLSCKTNARVKSQQRWGTARTLPNCTVCFASFCVLLLCKSVLYYCHWLATQLQLTYISSYHIRNENPCFPLVANPCQIRKQNCHWWGKESSSVVELTVGDAVCLAPQANGLYPRTYGNIRK